MKNENMPSKIELNQRQLWRLSISLEKVGYKSTNCLCNIRFIEDRNYEPPQGRIFIEDDFNGLVRVDERGYSGIWTLSEDKNERKDGLWIWGLFEEPKYPYLYFYLDVFNSTILASGEEEFIFGGLGVPNDRLNFRFNHVRDDKLGSLISNGQMTYQITELVKADPFGIGGTVNVGDNINAGNVNLTPVKVLESTESNVGNIN